MRIKETTLVKSLFCQAVSESPLDTVQVAIKTFGENSAVAKLHAQKNFSLPSSTDYNEIAASQQFINLIEVSSLLGRIKQLNKHIEMPLYTKVSSFDLEDCKVIKQSQPTNLLNETSQIGFTLESKKIGGFAIFPNFYFKNDMFSKVEPVINQALINSYVAGENTDFISMVKSGAVKSSNIDDALLLIKDPKNAVIIMHPSDALTLAKKYQLNTLGVTGGSYYGVSVLTDKSVIQGEKYIFDLSKLVLASDPMIALKKTDEATVQDLVGEAVYLFQQSKTAIKVIGENGYKFMNGYNAVLVIGE